MTTAKPASKPMEGIEIVPISVEQLRADKAGVLIEQVVAPVYHALREPPWSDEHGKPRLHFGLGIVMMRRNALAIIAKTKPSGRIVGHSLGFEVSQESEDPRDPTLYEISGARAFDGLFEGGGRVFYGDSLCVDPGFRRRHIAYRLCIAQIEELRRERFAYRIGRTGITADAMRTLYIKLGFRESPVHDAFYPERTYWLLRL